MPHTVNQWDVFGDYIRLDSTETVEVFFNEDGIEHGDDPEIVVPWDLLRAVRNPIAGWRINSAALGYRRHVYFTEKGIDLGYLGCPEDTILEWDVIDAMERNAKGD